MPDSSFAFHDLFASGAQAYGEADYAKAVTIFKEMRRRAQESGDEQAAADAAYQLGNVFRTISYYGEAFEMFTLALGYAVKTGDQRAIADCRLGLGNVYRGTSQYAEADREYAEAQQLYADGGHSWELVDVIVNQALVAYLRGDQVAAMEGLTAALDRYSQDPSRVAQVSECRANLANVYREQGDFGTAERLLEMVLADYRSIGDQVRSADCLLNLGNVYHQTGRSWEAGAAWKQARAVYNQRCLYERGADCTLNLGIIALESHELDQATRRFGAAAEQYARLGLNEHAADCRHNQGLAHLVAERPDTAAEVLATAQQDYRDHGLDVPPDCLAALAAAHVALGNYGAASRLYEQARGMFAKAKLMVDEARMSMNLAVVMWQDDTTNPDRCVRAQAALDLAIPALLTTDEVRFQFASARDRAAWRQLIHMDVSFVLDLAHASGDSELLGDLVESFTSVGWYAVDHDRAQNVVDVSVVSHSVRGDTPTGPIVLTDFDDISLPLLPPPGLRVLGPGGPRVALQRFPRHGGRRPTDLLTTW